MRYRVVAPYVTCTVPGAARLIGSRQIAGLMGFHAGAILPPDVPAEELERLARKGLIAEATDLEGA